MGLHARDHAEVYANDGGPDDLPLHEGALVVAQRSRATGEPEPFLAFYRRDRDGGAALEIRSVYRPAYTVPLPRDDWRIVGPVVSVQPSWWAGQTGHCLDGVDEATLHAWAGEARP